jgi:pimeloyl-ACP methyl ester carboxylesterase
VIRRLLPPSFLLILAASAQTAGPQDLTYFTAIDNSDQPYTAYIPKSYAAAPNAGRLYPLVISLHGAYSNHRLNMKRIFGKGNRPGESDPEATRYFPPLPDADVFVASPAARGSMGYRGMAEVDALTVLEDMKRRFPIDEDRIYLTGLSMGGGGTVELGLTRPGLWAAIAPLCPVEPWFGGALAGNAINLPVKFFHGDADPVVKIEGTRQLAARMKQEGVAVELQEYPGVAHNAWDYAYKDAAIFEWFLKFKRNRFPDRVRYVSPADQYREAYWFKIEQASQGGMPTVDAEFSATNRLKVNTTGVGGFSLNLNGHPKFDASGELEVTWNGRATKIPAGAALALGGKTPPRVTIADVTSAQHVYVYGTSGNPSPDELSRRKAEAEKAADWVGAGERLIYFPRVIADRDVRPSDLSGNLILFGTAGTNSLVARLGKDVPALKEDRVGEYGWVVAVPAPEPGRVYVINSGLPFWTGGEKTTRGGRDYQPVQQRMLMSLDEFILFRGSIADAVAEGRLAGAKLPQEVVTRP